MKPDWKDAPEWANYLVLDEDGEWYWCDHTTNHYGLAFIKSLERRPA